MKTPTWAEWYKKPEYRDIKAYSDAVAAGERTPSLDFGSRKTAIPHRLRFDRVLTNKTCSPMSLYDFYMYLKHIEFSDENLEFYMWFKNYESNWAKNKNNFRAADHPAFDASSTNLAAVPSSDGYGSDADLGENKPVDEEKHEDADVEMAGDAFHYDEEATENALNNIAFLISTNAVCANGMCRPRSSSARMRSASKLHDIVSTVHTSARALVSSHSASDPASPTSRIPSPELRPQSQPQQSQQPELQRSTSPDPEKNINNPDHVDMSHLPAPEPAHVATGPAPNTAPLAPIASSRAELDAIIRLFLLPSSSKELNIPQPLRTATLEALRRSADPVHIRPVAEHVYNLMKNCSHRNFVRLGVANGTYETVCVATGLGIFLTFFGLLFVLLRALAWPHIGANTRWNAFTLWPFLWLGLSLILAGLRGSCFFLLLFSRRQPLPWERFDESASVVSGKSGIGRIFSRLMIFDRKMRVRDEYLRRLQHKIVGQSLLGGAVSASLATVVFLFLPMWRETVI